MPPLKRSSVIRANLKNLRNANYFLSCKNKKELHKHKLKQLLVTSLLSYRASFLWAKGPPLHVLQVAMLWAGSRFKGWSPKRGQYFYAPSQTWAFPLILFLEFRKAVQGCLQNSFRFFNREFRNQSTFHFVDSYQAASKTAHSGWSNHLKVV